APAPPAAMAAATPQRESPVCDRSCMPISLCARSSNRWATIIADDETPLAILRYAHDIPRAGVTIVTTPHGYSRGLLSSTGNPSVPVPEGGAPAWTIFFAAFTSRSLI